MSKNAVLTIWTATAAALTCVTCGRDPAPVRGVAVVEAPAGVASAELLREAVNAFGDVYPDEFDQIVLWPSLGFLFQGSFYLALRNGVRGIGWGTGPDDELFSLEGYSSEYTAGVIVMGSGWHNFSDESGAAVGVTRGGRRALFGTLAEETSHQWGARVAYDDGNLGLLGRDAQHWSALLDVGPSPLGGSAWIDLGAGQFRAEPDEPVRLHEIDLYLMGALSAGEVPPLRLLHPADESRCGRLQEDGSIAGGDGGAILCPADVVESELVLSGVTTETVTIDQIVDAEGPRSPDEAPPIIRQAWVLLVPTGEEPDLERLRLLEQHQQRWEMYFESISAGRITIDTEL
jgi:hypothetical protein